MFAGLARDVRLEDFHHVFLGVCGSAGDGSLAVGRDVESLVAAVQQLHDVGWRGGVDDGGGDDLVHGFVVGWMGRIVDEAGAAAVDGTGEEGHSDAFLMGDSLEGADEIGPFKILGRKE